MLDSLTLSLGGVGGVQDKTTAARQSLGQTYDQFLSLLTTQLKNQDPLNPMDSKDFTNQLVSMANVEQSIAQTAKMDELIKLNQANAVNSTVLGYVGMQVEYTGSDFTYSGGTAIQFDYKLAADAAETKVNIYDKDNNLVWSADGDKSSGDHSLIWPGVDKDGKRVPVGNYKFEVVSKDSAGATVATTTPVTNFSYSNSSGMNLKYNLEADAKEAKISILNSAGQVVWTADAAKTAGDHVINWPGVDKDGKPVAAGSYTVQVGAKDKDDRAVKTSTIVPALVTGVEADNGSIKLLIGNQKVSIDTVKSVRLPG